MRRVNSVLSKSHEDGKSPHNLFIKYISELKKLSEGAQDMLTLEINKAIYKTKKFDRTLENQANFNSFMQNLPQNPVANYQDLQ